MPGDKELKRTKIVGVTYNSQDGINRQELISKLKRGDRLTLKRGWDSYYPEAIGLFNDHGQDLGNLSAELADEIGTDLDSGKEMYAEVMDITGGGPDRNYGCNIRIMDGNYVPPVKKTQINKILFGLGAFLLLASLGGLLEGNPVALLVMGFGVFLIYREMKKRRI